MAGIGEKFVVEYLRTMEDYPLVGCMSPWLL